MDMANACEVCGRNHTTANPVAVLTEARQAPNGTHERVCLCKNCLSRRETTSWSLRAKNGQVLHRVLDAQSEPRGNHFVYLEDERRLHLVRLRPEWLNGRAGRGGQGTRSTTRKAEGEDSFSVWDFP